MWDHDEDEWISMCMHEILEEEKGGENQQKSKHSKSSG